jgi:hypothetical protein
VEEGSSVRSVHDKAQAPRCSSTKPSAELSHTWEVADIS